MKKIGVITIVVFSLFLGGCVKKHEDMNSLEKVEDRGYLILGLDDTFAPMGFRDDNGEVVGFDIDLAKAVADELGVELRIQPIDWDSKTLELNAGNIDMIWNGLTITAEREKSILFSDPYLNNRQIVLVRSNEEITSLQELSGFVVGVQTGSSGESALESSDIYASIDSKVQYDTFVEAIMDLNAGRIDAIVVDEILARYVVEQNQYDVLVTEVSLGDEEYGIGFRINDVELRDAVDAALAKLESEGQTATISVNWFGKDIFK